MGAVVGQQPDSAGGVAEGDQVFAEQAHTDRVGVRVRQLFREQGRHPVASHRFAQRGPWADADLPASPTAPHLGLDHFGLRVDNLEEAVAELKRQGATFTTEPRTIRPGVKIAFIQCPDNVRVELLERR